MVVCSVLDCINTKKANPNICFFKFPLNEDARRKWTKYCNRDDNKFVHGVNVESTKIRICSDHFEPADIKTTLTGLKILKYGSIPTRQKPTPRDLRALNRIHMVNDENEPPRKKVLVDKTTSNNIPNSASCVNPTSPENVFCDHNYSTSVEQDQLRNVGTQTELTMEDIESLQNKNKSASKPSTSIDMVKLKKEEFTKSVVKNNSSVLYYTGIPTLSVLLQFFHLLEPLLSKLVIWGKDTKSKTAKKSNKSGPSRKLSLYEEFLLTLVRLRHGLGGKFISDLFGISEALSSTIFRTWVSFLSNNLSPILIKWPCTTDLKRNVPKSFSKYKDTTVIIDGTEFYVQKPSSPNAQRSSWSEYKSSNTMKALVGITPSGLFSFISQLWAGSISDRQITIDSGLLDLLQDGDEVMADRGFNIRDLLTEINVKLNIPPLVKVNEDKCYSAAAVKKTRQIASIRIHVERAIGRLKNFKILQGVIPLTLSPISDEIVLVCASLCNLLKPLAS